MATAISVQDNEAGSSGSKIGDLLSRITDDVKTIASNEIELAKMELTRTATRVIMDTALVLFGAIVALLGLGLLSLVAVVALEPVIPALWLRLLIVSAAYLVGGGLIAMTGVKKIKSAKPSLDLPLREAKQTLAAMKEGLRG